MGNALTVAVFVSICKQMCFLTGKKGVFFNSLPHKIIPSGLPLGFDIRAGLTSLGPHDFES
jgi:hypothetical protein